jgi:magnesium-transporting ATPase (P-type)
MNIAYSKKRDFGFFFCLANLEWIEGIAILVAVLVVVFVTAINDWRKERQFRGLQSKVEEDHQTSVVRDNHIQQIPVTDLVVGDLCFIKYGKNSNEFLILFRKKKSFFQVIFYQLMDF